MDEARTPAPLHVDAEGLTVPAGVGRGVLDVRLNGQHVWSINPARDASGSGWVPWPRSLRRFLVGRAEVEVGPTGSPDVVASATIVFGGRDHARVEVVDAKGSPLVVDKWGALVRPLSGEDQSVRDELLDGVEALLATLRDVAGVPAFICYGTLLGAVRNGHLIGHDNDVDLAYASSAAHPVDVNREGMRVERVLREAGWSVRRGSGVRLNVVMTLSDGSVRHVDVFSACWVEGVLYIPSDFGQAVPRDMVLPLSTVDLEGRRMPAPAEPEALLALTYGPGWTQPDPSFRFDSPDSLHRHFDGWFGGLVTHRKHWDAFGARAGRVVPREPSGFAIWTQEQLPPGGTVVDLGAGTGRDSMWFAQQGHDVLAVDYSPTALRQGLDHARQADAALRAAADRVVADTVNLYDLRAALVLGARLARAQRPLDLYGRFLLHSLASPGQENLLRLASMALRGGGSLYLEFRTTEDRGRLRTFRHGARHLVSVEQVVAAVERRGGRVRSCESGIGMASLGEEDPHVCRLVAAWR